MSAAKVNAGKMVVLDGRAEPDEVITEKDVQDASKLARSLRSVSKTLAELRRRFAPRRIDFEDIDIGIAAALVTLEHGFKTRVRWWVVGWQGSAAVSPDLRERTFTTDTTLVLRSYVAGLVTIRVEEAG